MKRALALVGILLAAMLPAAAAQSRNVVLSWTASTSSGVTGYEVFGCTVASGGTSCTPSTTGTPLATVTGATYTISEPTGAAYGYSIVTVTPACTPTTPLTTPCGNSAPVIVSYVPVPPQTNGASNLVIVVP
jgi:hypothetical protein